MTFYLGVVDQAEDGSWGVVFPDLPGCTSAGIDMDELFANSTEAVRLWAEASRDIGRAPPPSRDNAALLRDPEVRQALKAAAPAGCFIQVPLLLDGSRSVRANISIDADLLEAIDTAAKQRGVTRSAFLATAARQRINSGT